MREEGIRAAAAARSSGGAGRGSRNGSPTGAPPANPRPRPDAVGAPGTGAARHAIPCAVSRPAPWGMTRYQWTVFFAAWLGWGFDVFDGLLFNFVAPVCVPRLLGVAAGDPAGAARGTAVPRVGTPALVIGW